jgi:hypothetical protein
MRSAAWEGYGSSWTRASARLPEWSCSFSLGRKQQRGYGRITGDDGYIYFCHFSALQMDGYKSLR